MTRVFCKIFSVTDREVLDRIWPEVLRTVQESQSYEKFINPTIRRIYESVQKGIPRQNALASVDSNELRPLMGKVYDIFARDRNITVEKLYEILNGTNVSDPASSIPRLKSALEDIPIQYQNVIHWTTFLKDILENNPSRPEDLEVVQSYRNFNGFDLDAFINQYRLDYYVSDAFKSKLRNLQNFYGSNLLRQLESTFSTSSIRAYQVDRVNAMLDKLLSEGGLIRLQDQNLLENIRTQAKNKHSSIERFANNPNFPGIPYELWAILYAAFATDVSANTVYNAIYGKPTAESLIWSLKDYLSDSALRHYESMMQQDPSNQQQTDQQNTDQQDVNQSLNVFNEFVSDMMARRAPASNVVFDHALFTRCLKKWMGSNNKSYVTDAAMRGFIADLFNTPIDKLPELFSQNNLDTKEKLATAVHAQCEHYESL
jgi:hypothetical protein